MHCSDNWEKSENPTIEMSDLYVWKTNLFYINIGAHVTSLKIHKTDHCQFNFLLKEIICLIKICIPYLSVCLFFFFWSLTLFYFLPPSPKIQQFF